MEKQQVLFIDGGDSKDNFNNFNDYLNKFEYDPYEVKTKKWKNSLAPDLGEDFFLMNPKMPNKNFADYNERKIMFEKTFPYLENDIILVGHSMGGTFLIKYLEENNFPVKIKKIIIISGAFKDSPGDVIGNFNFDKTLLNLKKYENDIIFYQSKDDFVVPFSDLEDYRKIFPNSQYNIFENRGHFIDETFPELIEQIKLI
ncbi:MAG: alpha/beta hydrolase [Candidatus Gracilibacteria bacterium]